MDRGAPDFASLFADDAEIHQERDWILSPRTAYVLWDAADALHSWAMDEVAELGDTPYDPQDGLHWGLFNRYPRITWRQDALWRRYASQAYADLARDLAVGTWPIPENAAEEIALWLLVDEAENRWQYSDDDLPEEFWKLPEHPSDMSWDECRDHLFHDHDFLFLFDESMAGVEDPDNAMHEVVPDIADYRPVAWFDPFWNQQPRHPEQPTYRQAVAQRL